MSSTAREEGEEDGGAASIAEGRHAEVGWSQEKRARKSGDSFQGQGED